MGVLARHQTNFYSRRPAAAPKTHGQRLRAPRPCSRQRLLVQNAAVQVASDTVDVTVFTLPNNSRRLFATVDINAPLHTVWRALTDYDRLGDFIPGLAKNECLRRCDNGATLLQIAEQPLAFGATFKATVKLQITEHKGGAPPWVLSKLLPDNAAGLRQWTSAPQPTDDIQFDMVEGDFQVFSGVWRMQQGTAGPSSCALSYGLLVSPQRWLPVGLVQSLVQGEVKNNLTAVRRYAEKVHRLQRSAGNGNGAGNGASYH